MRQIILVGFILAIISSMFPFSPAWAAPAQILIIRHAEKPDQDGEDDGFRSGELSQKGKQRAQALATLFTTRPEFTQYGPPVAIYAAAKNPRSGSIRPIQTVQPLAERLSLTIHNSLDTTQIQDLIDEIMNNDAYTGKTVVICWAHPKNFPVIAETIGVNDPPRWKKHSFDRVWKVNLSDGSVSDFSDLPQHLLPGDS